MRIPTNNYSATNVSGVQRNHLGTKNELYNFWRGSKVSLEYQPTGNDLDALITILCIHEL
jgi:hypothetical protein